MDKDELIKKYTEEIDRVIDSHEENETPCAGSWKAIKHELGDVFYELCHVADELLHATTLDRFEWALRFCDWSHRKD